MSYINLDTSTAIAFVADGSPIRAQLEAYVSGKQLIMAATAYAELTKIMNGNPGQNEQSNLALFLPSVIVVPDQPSARAKALIPSKSLGVDDIIILGTGDQLGIVTMTADRRSVSAARAQGVGFSVYLHPPVPLTWR